MLNEAAMPFGSNSLRCRKDPRQRKESAAIRSASARTVPARSCRTRRCLSSLLDLSISATRPEQRTSLEYERTSAGCRLRSSLAARRYVGQASLCWVLGSTDSLTPSAAHLPRQCLPLSAGVPKPPFREEVSLSPRRPWTDRSRDFRAYRGEPDSRVGC